MPWTPAQAQLEALCRDNPDNAPVVLFAAKMADLTRQMQESGGSLGIKFQVTMRFNGKTYNITIPAAPRATDGAPVSEPL